MNSLTLPTAPRRSLVVAGATLTALVSTAAWVAQRAQSARSQNPPAGNVVNVDDTQVHYLERGHGTPLVLLHGNTLRLEDFVASGLVERLARNYRVLAFDRPGFGYSERPRNRLWTAEAQAALLGQALLQLGVERPIVLGHSWGTLVALELALIPSVDVRKLVLISGYYFATPRLDAVLATPVAIPVLGDVMRYTVSALSARLLLGRTVRAMFAPQAVPVNFMDTLNREMLLRPVQIRANAEDAAYMMPSASALQRRYSEVHAPAMILAGAADKVVDPEKHARRLHVDLENSQLHLLPGVGHMLHHADPARVVDAIGAD
jgi:pimeloyl-ACP methyl ester carboxylesterase